MSSEAEEFSRALAAAFRQMRVVRGMTQEDFVPESGRTFISELERGVKKPTVSKLRSLTECMDVHLLSLLTAAFLETNPKVTFPMLQKRIERELLEIRRENMKKSG